MKYNTRVSICIPVYGVEQYIGRCAESLFKQTYDNIEYVFVNDCTNDRSIEILKSIILNYPQRKTDIHIINHPYNRGLAAARNTAVRACTGEFIMHVDSDDYIDVDTVEVVLKEQLRGNYDIVSFGFYREYKNKTIIQLPPMTNDNVEMCKILIKKEANVGVCGRLYRTNLYKIYDIRAKEGCNMGEDYQVSPILMFHAYKIYNLQQPKYHYDLTNENSHVYSISLDKSRQLFTSFSIIFDFFSKQGEGFKDSLIVAKLKVIIRLMQNCVKGDWGIDEFNKYKLLLNNKQIKYYKALPLTAIIVAVVRNYNILKFGLKLIKK